MSLPPFPNLAPQQQPSILDQAGKILSLKSMLGGQQLQQQQITGATQENQLRQQQLSDQNGYKLLLKDTGGDPSKMTLSTLADPKYGISAMGQIDLVKNMTALRTSLAGMNDAEFKVQQNKNEMFRTSLESIKSAPPEQKNDIYAQTLQKAQQGGVDVSSLPQQYPGDDKLDDFANHLELYGNLLKEQDAKKTAEARIVSANTGAARLAQEGDPNSPLNTAKVQTAVNAENAEIPIKAAQGAATAAAEIPAKVALETDPKVIAARVWQQVQAQKQLSGGQGGALGSVPPHLVAPATSAATKAGVDYATAQQTSDDFKNLLDLSKQGNKVAYSYDPVAGVLQFNTASGTKRINFNEIQAYGGSGSAMDRIKAFLGKETSGQSIDASVLHDMGQVQSAVETGAQDKYKRDIQVVNKTYGAKFEPLDFSQKPGAAPAASFSVSAGGKTYNFKDQASLDAFKKEAGLK